MVMQHEDLGNRNPEPRNDQSLLADIARAYAESRSKNRKRTFEDTAYDWARESKITKFYFNGIQVFKDGDIDAETITNVVTTSLADTDQDIIHFILENCNQPPGFRDIAARVVNEKMLEKTGIAFKPAKSRYDFVKNNDGTVSFFARAYYYNDDYKDEKGNRVKKLSFVDVTEFVIGKDNNKVKIAPVTHQSYLIDLKEVKNINVPYLVQYLNFTGKMQTIENLDNKLDYDFCTAALKQLVSEEDKSKINILEINKSNNWIALEELIEEIMLANLLSPQANKLENLLKLEITPSANIQRHRALENRMEGFASLFYQVFRSDSYNPRKNEFNYAPVDLLKEDSRSPYKIDPYIRQYQLDPITMISTFFGLPNQCALGEIPTWGNIGRNLLGLEKNKSDFRNAINLISIPIVLPANLIISLFMTLYHSLKLVAEFLPVLAAEGLKRLAEYPKNEYEKTDETARAFVNGVFYVALMTMSSAFQGIGLLGRAIVDPIGSMEAAWYFCQNYNREENESRRAKILRNIAGVALIVLSAAVTASVYILLPVLLVKFVPGFAAGLSTFMMKSGLSQVFSWIGTNIVTPLFGNLLTSMGITVSPAVLGFGATIVAGVLTIGGVLKPAVDSIKEAWRFTGKKEEIELRNIIADANTNEIVKEVLDQPAQELQSSEEQKLIVEPEPELITNLNLSEQGHSSFFQKESTEKSEMITWINQNLSFFENAIKQEHETSPAYRKWKEADINKAAIDELFMALEKNQIYKDLLDQNISNKGNSYFNALLNNPDIFSAFKKLKDSKQIEDWNPEVSGTKLQQGK